MLNVSSSVNTRLIVFLGFIGTAALLLNLIGRNIQDSTVVNTNWSNIKLLGFREQKNRLEVSNLFIQMLMNN